MSDRRLSPTAACAGCGQPLTNSQAETANARGEVFHDRCYVLPDGCVEGHSPSRAGCSLGVDYWPRGRVFQPEAEPS